MLSKNYHKLVDIPNEHAKDTVSKTSQLPTDPLHGEMAVAHVWL